MKEQAVISKSPNSLNLVPSQKSDHSNPDANQKKHYHKNHNQAKNHFNSLLKALNLIMPRLNQPTKTQMKQQS